MNTPIIDVFDEIVFALFKSRNFLPNAVWQTAFDRHPTQQPTCVAFAFLSVRQERFDFRVLNVAAQNISQSENIRSRESVWTIGPSSMRVYAKRMRPARRYGIEGYIRQERPFTGVDG